MTHIEIPENLRHAVNTAPFSWDELARITGGAWRLPPPASPGVRGVTDHSGAVQPGCLFMALPGENTDGSRFLEAALNAGAAAVCISETWEPDPEVLRRIRSRSAAVLSAASPLEAYHALAGAHRRRFPDLFLAGITGSSGKTSVKEFLAAIFAAHAGSRCVLKTAGNTNNQFGVPRNLLRLERRHRFAAIEIGTNHPGEIAALSRPAGPDAGVVVSIGPAHLEFFHSLEGVAREKSALFAAVPAGGLAVFPANAPGRVRFAAAARHCELRTFAVAGTRGAESADLVVAYGGLASSGAGYRLRFSGPLAGPGFDLVWSIGGRHQAANAGAAAALALARGIPLECVRSGLRAARLPGQRMQESRQNGICFINDAYNANPASVRAGLEWFREITAAGDGRRCVVILGDMLELGEHSEAAHREVLELACERFPRGWILAVGAEMQQAAQAFPAVEWFADLEAVRKRLAEGLKAGDWVYIKGSHALGLDALAAPGDGP